jgi:exopolyphosphatase/guanosine-5'-triphosphate,3'-diphosphate pyrophosphatase
VTRVGVVDLGTNSTRLLVADVEDGAVREVDRRLTITRLGEGVDARGLLLPTAIARVRNVLTEYRRTLEDDGAERTLAVATSAVRDADNGEAFLGEVEWSYGFGTRLLTGSEEAIMTFAGVAAGRELAASSLVVDIGGGSMELVLGGPEGIAWHRSLELGCVRLTERFIRSDPPGVDDVEACSAHVRALLEREAPGEPWPERAIGVAGTVTTLATLSLELETEDPALVHRHRMSRGWIAAEVERLAALSIAGIRAVPGIHHDRASVIVAGGIVLAETLRHFGLWDVEASEQDLMHGAALAAAAMPEPPEGNTPPGAYACC